jgi:hypothetical protein
MCFNNFLASWPLLEQLGQTAEGRSVIAESMGLCEVPSTAVSVTALISGIQEVFFDMAEGDYPFPSTYITSAVGPGQYPLPAWPMQVACEGLNDDLGIMITGDTSQVDFTVTATALSSASNDVSISVNWDSITTDTIDIDDVMGSGIPALLQGVGTAWGVWCNVTGELTCLSEEGCAGTGMASSFKKKQEKLSKINDEQSLKKDGGDGNTCTNTFSGTWNSVYCNDELNLVNYLVQGVGSDMFWPPNVPDGWLSMDYDDALASLIGPDGQVDSGCASPPGIYGYPSTFDPYGNWLDAWLGGTDLNAYSNIVFSNGLLDPWSAAGVYLNGVVPSPGVYDGPAIVNLTDDGSLKSLILDLGAHHLDIMFSDDNDPECAQVAREVELGAITDWIDQFNAQAVIRGARR